MKEISSLDWVGMVQEWHRTFEHPFVPSGKGDWLDLIELRSALVSEEIDELWHGVSEMKAALESGSSPRELKAAKVETLDAIADSIYVLVGMANLLGFDLREAFSRVHESNMSKLGENGLPIYSAKGKVLKGPNFHLPVLDDLVD